MAEHNPHSTAKVADHPLHPMIVPFPIAFLVSAFATDLTYLSTGSARWATASMWLLGAGIAMALLAAVLGLTDFLGDREVRRIREAWLHMIGNLVAVSVAAVNFYLRTGDPTETIAPVGVVLSGAMVALLLFNGWMGWAMVYRHHVGVSDEPSPVRVTADRRPM